MSERLRPKLDVHSRTLCNCQQCDEAWNAFSPHFTALEDKYRQRGKEDEVENVGEEEVDEDDSDDDSDDSESVDENQPPAREAERNNMKAMANALQKKATMAPSKAEQPMCDVEKFLAKISSALPPGISIPPSFYSTRNDFDTSKPKDPKYTELHGHISKLRENLDKCQNLIDRERLPLHYYRPGKTKGQDYISPVTGLLMEIRGEKPGKSPTQDAAEDRTRGSADWSAEVIILATSMAVGGQSFFESCRLIHLLDCKGVDFFVLDVSSGSGLPDHKLASYWLREDSLLCDAWKHGNCNWLVPQVLIDGVRMGSALDIRALEGDNDFDYILGRQVCPNCLAKRRGEDSCAECFVTYQNLLELGAGGLNKRELEIIVTRSQVYRSTVGKPSGRKRALGKKGADAQSGTMKRMVSIGPNVEMDDGNSSVRKSVDEDPSSPKTHRPSVVDLMGLPKVVQAPIKKSLYSLA